MSVRENFMSSFGVITLPDAFILSLRMLDSEEGFAKPDHLACHFQQCELRWTSSLGGNDHRSLGLDSLAAGIASSCRKMLSRRIGGRLWQESKPEDRDHGHAQDIFQAERRSELVRLFSRYPAQCG